MVKIPSLQPQKMLAGDYLITADKIHRKGHFGRVCSSMHKMHLAQKSRLLGPYTLPTNATGATFLSQFFLHSAGGCKIQSPYYTHIIIKPHT